MSAFIREFRTTNELLFKESNNSLSELRFKVNGLLKVIDNALISNCEVKGVTTRGGKMTTQGIHNHNADIHTKEPLVFHYDQPVAPIKVHVENEPQKTKEQVVQPPIKLQTPSIPFPRRLTKEKEKAQQQKFLENLKQLHINFPFIEALAQMPKYTKFLKSLLTNKARIEEAYTVTMNERCSTILLNKLPSKEKDPGSFTIPCDIGHLHINNALADLGASISLMPYTMYEKLGLGEPKPTRMSLELADRSSYYQGGGIIVENVLIKVNKFILPVDFVILDMPEDPRDANTRINSVNTPYSETQKTTGTDEVNSEHLYLASANKIDEKKPKLKDLPHHLEYAYLHGSKSFPIIISSKFSKKEKMLLEKHSLWVSPIHVVLKKGGMTVVLNDNNELIPSRTVTGWRVRMPFGLCNAPATFQRCMTAIFHDMVEDFMEEFMDDFSVFGQRIDGKFKPIYYASKTLNNAQEHYTTTEKELLAVVFSFDKFRPYLILSKTVVYTNDSTLKYLFSKQDVKPTLIRVFFYLGKHIIKKRDASKQYSVAVDYVSKWVKAIPTNDAHVVIKFLRGLFARFGVPKALISIRGTYFCNFKLEKALRKYRVAHKLSTAYHPQTNGQTEVTNRVVKRILESSVGYNPKDWFEKLNDALWAFRTTYKTPTGSAAKNRFMELNELMELRDGAYENTRIYKERIKKWDDSRLRGDKDFKVRDKVLLFNSRLRMHPGKLKSKWYGPNVVKTVYPYRIVEITDKNGISFKVNGQSLKKYYDGHIDTEGKEVVEFEEDTA
ncbi:reverse transcriptase domain-containing protein [Tanacetum coccineum]